MSSITLNTVTIIQTIGEKTVISPSSFGLSEPVALTKDEFENGHLYSFCILSGPTYDDHIVIRKEVTFSYVYVDKALDDIYDEFKSKVIIPKMKEWMSRCLSIDINDDKIQDLKVATVKYAFTENNEDRRVYYKFLAKDYPELFNTDASKDEKKVIQNEKKEGEEELETME